MVLFSINTLCTWTLAVTVSLILVEAALALWVDLIEFTTFSTYRTIKGVFIARIYTHLYETLISLGEKLLAREIQMTFQRDHSVRTHSKISERLTFLTP